MEIYLIRHTTPKVKKGICYGWADLDVTETFEQEANAIKNILPNTIEMVYSSPLQRCSKLANHLFTNKKIIYQDDLKEINCGSWEMQDWDAIPKAEINPWMDDFVNVIIPNGESYIDLFERVTKIFNYIFEQKQVSAIVAHGGVLRSVLAHVTNTPLVDSFNAFKINYGCVVKIYFDENNLIQYQMLHDVESPKEQHKPSYM
jgi:alpha-ribazole phosphatase